MRRISDIAGGMNSSAFTLNSNRETKSYLFSIKFEKMPMLALQFLFLLLLLGCVVATRPFRQWFLARTRGQRTAAAAMILLVIGGHFLCLGKYTFPLVNWSMYAQLNETAEFQTVELVYRRQDGKRQEINPIRTYPSLIHTLTPRLVRLVRAAHENRLTQNGESVYHDVMRSIAHHSMFQLDPEWNPDPTDELEVYLLTIRKSDRQVLERRLVSIHRSPHHLASNRRDATDVFLRGDQ